VLMAWEDLHWADPTTLETLGMLIEQAPTAAMLVVATYRPELTPPWPQRSHMTPITLNRLSGRRSRRWSVIWPAAGRCPTRWSIISSPRPTACRSILAPILAWFTEGFDTADLQAAKTILDKLTEPAIAAEG
jgi:hypothetical protein